MKIFSNKRILVAFVCAIAINHSIKAQDVIANGNTARSGENRAANFGVTQPVDTDPKTYPQGKPMLLTITAEPGKTHRLTAVSPDSENAGLVAN